MRTILLLIALLAASIGNTQMLDNTKGKTFGDTPFFNESFVKRNHIKSIKGYYSTKATLDVIRKTKDVYEYQFNNDGQLVLDYRTQYGDTLVKMYTYNEKGLLTVLRKSDQAGFHSYHYKYDEKGRIIEKEYRKDVNKNGDKLKFKLDRAFIISVEKFEYVDLEGENYKKIFFNNAGKVYQEEFFYFEENGYLIKQESRLKMGSGYSKTTYVYDEKGRVKEKTQERALTSKQVHQWKYKYDEVGNLMAMHHYKDQKYLMEYQIVYNEKTMLLKAIITRDEVTNLVTILQFSEVEFFN